MATVIARDHNRYEVVQVINPDDRVLNVAISSDPAANTSTTTDSFGRLRVSNPLTLFDSSHRYNDNGLWATQTASSGAATFNANQGLMDLSVTTTSGSKVIRETKRVFSYQPGKSLLVLNTFTFNAAKTNLRQRVGYYGVSNGYYLELNGSTLSFVERSSITGSVANTAVAQADWNIDKLDGTGRSGLTLDITKSQILWADYEWLGVGTVRVGFIINGQYVHCHSFHHANLVAGSYITTASLPIRYEIENTGTTASNSTLKQICSSVISEGGYELSGGQLTVGQSITSPYSLTTAGTYYPLVSLRLKTTRLDAIVILSALSVLGSSNNVDYSVQLVEGGTTTGGTWVSAGANSSVEYNITGTSFTGGTQVMNHYIRGTAQGSSPLELHREQLFKFQLDRDSLAGTVYELTLTATGSANASLIFGSVDWEEVGQ